MCVLHLELNLLTMFLTYKDVNCFCFEKLLFLKTTLTLNNMFVESIRGK